MGKGNKAEQTQEDWLIAALKKTDRAKMRGKIERVTKLYAISAQFDSKKKVITIELANGLSFSFPPKLVEGLSRRSADSISSIEISPMGTGLYWPKLDVDLTVEGLLSGMFGSERWMLRQHLAKAGSVKSAAKSKASRQNGAKGGRPKKEERAPSN
jgi:hypothetical protein